MKLIDTINAYQAKDPSATSKLEVLLYPGLWATGYYRIAHFLYQNKLHFIARLISIWARFVTGIEIHPGAIIGERFVIDHGMGIVIGGTSIIGDDVLMYHNVTLGATKMNNDQRHPTIQSKVTIGAGALILGDIIVEEGATIAAGAIVLANVPQNKTVFGLYK
ncbi:MAG: serine acetyltransferase [Erysipelothrix sp.]|nr:serine acetyltransferase [Erysipelothrix sp.]